MTHLCIQFNGERTTLNSEMKYLIVLLGSYYRTYLTDKDFDWCCILLTKLAKEYQNGHIDLQWYLEIENRYDPTARKFYKDVLRIQGPAIRWDKVPGETPAMWGNKAVWVHNLNIDRGYYTARTWGFPRRSSEQDLGFEGDEALAGSWERPRYGDIAVSLKSLEPLTSCKWKDLTSLPQLGEDVLPTPRFLEPSDNPFMSHVSLLLPKAFWQISSSAF